MTHSIQIGVAVDEEAIEKAVIQGAVNEISKALFPNGWTKPGYRYFRNDWSQELKDIVDQKVEQFLTDSRQEIIDKVAADLSERLMKSRTFKEKVVGKV